MVFVTRALRLFAARRLFVPYVLRRRRAGRRGHLRGVAAVAPPVGAWKCRLGRAAHVHRRRADVGCAAPCDLHTESGAPVLFQPPSQNKPLLTILQLQILLWIRIFSYLIISYGLLVLIASQLFILRHNSSILSISAVYLSHNMRKSYLYCLI